MSVEQTGMFSFLLTYRFTQPKEVRQTYSFIFLGILWAISVLMMISRM